MKKKLKKQQEWQKLKERKGCMIFLIIIFVICLIGSFTDESSGRICKLEGYKMVPYIDYPNTYYKRCRYTCWDEGDTSFTHYIGIDGDLSCKKHPY